MNLITRELNGGYRTYDPSKYENDLLYIEHNSGPFSCSTISLQDIMIFYNDNKKIPLSVFRNKQFGTCKINPYDYEEDITKIIYEEDSNYKIEYDRERFIIDLPKISLNEKVEGTYPAHSAYRDILHEDVKPFIKKYFQPSREVMDRIRNFEIKYDIDYDNTCVILYRGAEKGKEMPISDYNFFIDKAKSINHSNIKFMVQTEEMEFLNECKLNLENVFNIEECQIYPMDRKETIFDKLSPNLKRDHIINYFSSLIIGSKCKYAITHTGNGGFWLSLYRGNANNLYQAKCGNSKVCGDIYHRPDCHNIWVD